MRKGTLVAALLAMSVSSSLMVSGQSGKTLVMAVGVDDYRKEGIPDLKYAGSDAKLLVQAAQDLLGAPKSGGTVVLTSDNVQEAYQPNRLNILSNLSDVAKAAGPNDTLVFFFAGHGVSMEGTSYLLAEDSDNKNSVTLKASAVSGTDLTSILNSSKAGNLMVFLDACRNDPSGAAPANQQVPTEFYFPGANRKAITVFSCNVGEKSWEWKERQHGFFTYFLVDGLRKGGHVTVGSLTSHVSRTVPQETAKYANGAKQTPYFQYAGPALDTWTLAGTGASAVAGSGGADTSAYVTKLANLQAQLDKEMALRKIAEDKLAKVTAHAQELEARMSLLQKGVAGSEPNKENEQLRKQVKELTDQVTKLQASSGGGSNVAELQLKVAEAEKLKLAAENKELMARLQLLEAQLKDKSQVAVSRDVQLEEKLEKERIALDTSPELQVFRGVVDKAFAEPNLNKKLEMVAKHPVREKLERERQWIESKLAYLERNFGAAVNTNNDPGVAFFKDAVKLAQMQRSMYDAGIASANLAVADAITREQISANPTAPPDPAKLAQLDAQQTEAQKARLQLKQVYDRVQELEDYIQTSPAYMKRWTATRGNWHRITRPGYAADIGNVPIKTGVEEAEGFGPKASPTPK